MRHLLLSIVIGAAFLPTLAQDDKPPAPKPVTVPVVVRDHRGGPVAGLAATNFTVKVDDAAQPVLSATQDATTPITYGLVMDVGRAQRSFVDDERKAARAVVAHLRPGDKAFVVQFARQIELLQDPTADHARLERAINELGTPSPSFQPIDPNDGGIDSEGRRIRSAGPVLYDALFLSADEVLAKEPGRRVLIVFSDGIDVGSKMSMSEAKEAVERAGILIYGVYSRGTESAAEQRQTSNNRTGRNGNGGGWPGGGYPGGGYPGGGYPGGGYPGGGYPGQYPNGGNNPNDPNNPNNPNGGSTTPNGPGRQPSKRPNVDGRGALAKLSSDTGGRVFDTGKKGGALDDEVAAIADDLHSAYWVSFTPQGPAARHGFHPMDLLVTGSDKSRKVEVQTASGYYGG